MVTSKTRQVGLPCQSSPCTRALSTRVMHWRLHCCRNLGSKREGGRGRERRISRWLYTYDVCMHRYINMCVHIYIYNSVSTRQCVYMNITFTCTTNKSISLLFYVYAYPIYRYMHSYTCASAYVGMHGFTCTCVRVCVCISVCMHGCMYACIYVCM